MCLTIPHKIISVKGSQATVACGKDTHTLDIRLVPKAKKGDYVMNENNFAVHIVPKTEARETLKLINSIKK